MIVILKEGSMESKKSCYMTKCGRCNTKFIFNDDDIKIVDFNRTTHCPVCSNKIPEITEEEGYPCLNFKKIPQWRYNRLVKSHNKTGDIDH